MLNGSVGATLVGVGAEAPSRRSTIGGSVLIGASMPSSRFGVSALASGSRSVHARRQRARGAKKEVRSIRAGVP